MFTAGRLLNGMKAGLSTEKTAADKNDKLERSSLQSPTVDG